MRARGLIEYVGDRMARWPTKVGGHEGVREMTDFSLRLREQQLHRYLAAHDARPFTLTLDVGYFRRWQGRLTREITRRGLAPLP